MMGHVRVEAILSGAKTKKQFNNVLVDTGATYTTLPTQLANELGVIETPWKVKVLLADGRAIDAKLGVVEIEVKGRRGGTLAAISSVFPLLLGVRTLEDLGFKVDPIKGDLEPTRPEGVLLFKI